MFSKKFLTSIVLPIVVIFLLASAGYMFIYANNPYMELTSFFMTLMIGNRTGQPAPDFVGIASWINSDGVSIQDLRGQVVIVDFWTYSCVNCQRDLPYVVDWYKKYHDQGLEVVGVHTPEFRFEQKRENVEQEVAKYGIDYPVALDNEYKTWRAYHNHYWPAKYIIDKQGNIIELKIGEGSYLEIEALIQQLLAE